MKGLMGKIFWAPSLPRSLPPSLSLSACHLFLLSPRLHVFTPRRPAHLLCRKKKKNTLQTSPLEKRQKTKRIKTE